MSRRKKQPADYHELAATHGLRWLGPEAMNAQSHTKWQCLEKGHPFTKTYNAIQQGSGCPRCGKQAHPGVINQQNKELRESAQQSKGVAVCDEVAAVPLECRVEVPEPMADYHDLAAEKGLICLGPPVSGHDEPTGWKCKEGHSWTESFNGIQEVSGCPKCLRMRKTGPPNEMPRFLRIGRVECALSVSEDWPTEASVEVDWDSFPERKSFPFAEEDLRDLCQLGIETLRVFAKRKGRRKWGPINLCSGPYVDSPFGEMGSEYWS